VSAYLIARVMVRDPRYIAEYQSKTEPLIQRHHGQILVGAVGGTDSMAILEGAKRCRPPSLWLSSLLWSRRRRSTETPITPRWSLCDSHAPTQTSC